MDQPLVVVEERNRDDLADIEPENGELIETDDSFDAADLEESPTNPVNNDHQDDLAKAWASRHLFVQARPQNSDIIFVDQNGCIERMANI